MSFAAPAPVEKPVCLCSWLENPYSLVSLWDMLRVNADHFVAAATNIGQILMDLRIGHMPDPASAGITDSSIEILRKCCEELGLTLSAEQAKRINARAAALRAIENRTMAPLGELEAGLRELQQRICDELKLRIFLQVPIDKARYYEPDEPPFGQAVFDSFGSAIEDVLEAGNCLALDRDTAVVFHLMRVLEAGLKVLGKELGIPYAPSWESYLRQLATIIEGDWKSKSEAEKRNQSFYKDVLGDLQAIKLAWRNPTMHIVKSYSPEEAAHIYGCVKQFMVRLASNGLGE